MSDLYLYFHKLTAKIAEKEHKHAFFAVNIALSVL